jgi:large subunit ribosomal protein L21
LDALTALRAQLEKAESTPAEKKAAPKKEAAKPAAKKEAPKKEKSESTSAIAELKDLTGVGPAMVKRMSALGINTVEELVAITDEQAASFNEQDSKISVEQWNKWIAEAKG